MDRFRRMEIFVAVIETGQITRAAKRLHLSKSAVSHALTNLEQYLELQLLTRNNRTWQLTDAGTIYYEQCKKILADVETIEEQLRGDSQSLSGLIRISASETFGSYTLVPVIAKFMALHPGIVIDLSITERFVDLVEERTDLCFRTGHLKHSGLVGKTIGEAKMMVCASPDYFEKYGEPQSHQDLKTHKCLRFARSPLWRLYKNDQSYEFTPRDHIMTDSGESLREFAIRGQGLAYMPNTLGGIALKKGRLVKTLKDYACGTFPINALRVGNNRAPVRVVKLFDFIVDELNSRQNDANMNSYHVLKL